MNKQHELNALKEQRQQLDKQIERVEAELKKENDKWSEGHWYVHHNGNPYIVESKPMVNSLDLGIAFTTKSNCQSYIDYQKAMVRLRDACRPYLTEDYGNAYIPCVDEEGNEFSSDFASAFPKFLWVKGSHKAEEIAKAQIEDLKIIQNFKCEV